ncbi:hypothetical Protein YC6258_02520 [Gynuella sunshinyii YC6258]|uniref:Uncharacterized protein n=1 Tax=Gynuella sunshinyii YC6258 TaxID=1445510 RepID=A0A0C5VMI6_9GAMM|nr:hypothetical Protein YC6258_02520 [Gynuella sunshinyii YC6258]
MSRIRNQTLLDIDRVLKTHLNYPYEVKNHPQGNPFLSIYISEKPIFHFSVSHAEVSGQFLTFESPGKFLETNEKCLRQSFQLVLQALNQWVARAEAELTKTDHLKVSKTNKIPKTNPLTNDYHSELLNTESILQSYIVDVSQ